MNLKEYKKKLMKDPEYKRYSEAYDEGYKDGYKDGMGVTTGITKIG